ncbi:MAG: SH3 domain-containing protein, partial [Caldilineaceae bacterium]
MTMDAPHTHPRPMRTRRLSLLAVALLLTHLLLAAIPAAPALAQEDAATSGIVVATIPRLNVRSGPAVSFPIVGKLPAGSALTVVGRSDAGDWLRVTAAALSGEGWVSASFVLLGGVVTSAEPTA